MLRLNLPFQALMFLTRMRPPLVFPPLPRLNPLHHRLHLRGRLGLLPLLLPCPDRFDDHFSQAALFYASLTSIEQRHIADAYTFELGKVYEQAIKERALTVLAKIDGELCATVAAGLGLPAPRPAVPAHGESPALRQIKPTPFPIAGRIVGVVAGPGADLAGIGMLR